VDFSGKADRKNMIMDTGNGDQPALESAGNGIHLGPS
jgi:hypothetical protein